MYTHFSNVFNNNISSIALIWNSKEYTYEQLLKKIKESRSVIKHHNIKPGTVVGLNADFSPNSVALLFALIERKCIIVPLAKKNSNLEQPLIELAKVQYGYTISNDDKIYIKKTSLIPNNKYYQVIYNRAHAGLVLFSSGTSGKQKAAVHDFHCLLKKFKTRRKALRTLNFFLFDHWGGLNTMFHILSNGGTIITTEERKPECICRLIEKYKIELLPTSPTFLNLMLLSKAYEKFDTSSLKIISYGSEPMPESTLERLKSVFPNVQLLQTYGLIELGVMSSKSEKDDSLWVKVGGKGYKTRIIDGILQIKADSAMLGYLNAESPFTNDGWFITGDQVVQKGEYIKILGRKSEIINVGGEKVYPLEVENVILKLPNVAEVTVYGKANSIIGNIICAKVRLIQKEDETIFKQRLKEICSLELEKFKIPMKVKIVNEVLYSERIKKLRTSNTKNTL